MADKEIRVKKLEQEMDQGQPAILVDWESDGLTLDESTGERVTPAEWMQRHPGEELLIVRWDDDETEES